MVNAKNKMKNLIFILIIFVVLDFTIWHILRDVMMLTLIESVCFCLSGHDGRGAGPRAEGRSWSVPLVGAWLKSPEMKGTVKVYHMPGHDWRDRDEGHSRGSRPIAGTWLKSPEMKGTVEVYHLSGHDGWVQGWRVQWKGTTYRDTAEEAQSPEMKEGRSRRR